MLERNTLLEYADQETRDDVDGHDENSGQRISLTEAGCAVHGTAKLCLARHHFPAFSRLLGVDKPGIQIGIDGHLLSRHGVEGESGRHLGSANGAVAHHEILDGNEREKDYKADNVISAHYKLSECLDHPSRRR